MIREGTSAKERLVNELGLSAEEADLYLLALREGGLGRSRRELVGSLLSRGMLIRSADEKGYVPVHPRLALSNLFRSYQERVAMQVRERRKMVDRLTLELIPVYEAGRKVD